MFMFNKVITIMPYSLSDIFALMSFYPSMLSTLILSRVLSRDWYSRIDQWVILGALPLRSVAKELVEVEGVKGVVSLTQDLETRDFTPTDKEWEEMGVELFKIPTLDFIATPTQENIQGAINFILRHRQLNNSVYVHCKAGRTRSATVVACYLIQVNKWTPEEAINYITSKRPHIWLRDLQLKSVDTFYKNYWKIP